MTRIGFAGKGQVILLVGAPPAWGTHLAQSIYMRDIHGRTDGPPPPVDLAHEKRVGDFVRKLIRSGTATAVHDCSDGGLAVALAEMAIASGIGATIPGLTGTDPIPVFFGEDQGRYLVTLDLDPQSDGMTAIWDEAKSLGIHAPWIGTTGGAELKLGGARAIPVAELKSVHESWFPRFMDGK
jgi:phosphoribosylformylglycinamidine synthase